MQSFYHRALMRSIHFRQMESTLLNTCRSHPVWSNWWEQVRSQTLRITLVFLLSAVVSSNSWPSLKEISVFLKALSVRIVMISPFLLMITLGLAKFPNFLVANPTPENPDSVRLCWSRESPCETQATRYIESKEFRLQLKPPLTFPPSLELKIFRFYYCKCDVFQF